MGCDIHLYVEYKNNNSEKEYWRSFGGRINPGRNYLLFGIMSNGVRSDPSFSFEPKGKPDNMSYEAQSDSQLYISEKGEGDGETTLERARRWEQQGCKITNNSNGEPTWVEHPDWHSHSWLITDEFEKALRFYRENSTPYWPECEYEAILAAMQKLEELNNKSRIVFWFDN